MIFVWLLEWQFVLLPAMRLGNGAASASYLRHWRALEVRGSLLGPLELCYESVGLGLGLERGGWFGGGCRRRGWCGGRKKQVDDYTVRLLLGSACRTLTTDYTNCRNVRSHCSVSDFSRSVLLGMLGIYWPNLHSTPG